MKEFESNFDYGEYEVVPDFMDLTEEDVLKMRMSQDVSRSLEEQRLDDEGNTQFKPWITSEEFNELVTDLSGNGILQVFDSEYSEEVIASIEGLLKSDAPYLDAKIINLPYRYGENGKKRWDTIYRADVPEKGKVIPASILDKDKVLSLASDRDAYGNGILKPRFVRNSIKEQLLAAEMDVYEFIWFVIHPKWLKLLNLSKAAYRKPNIDLTKWTTKFCLDEDIEWFEQVKGKTGELEWVKKSKKSPKFTYKVDCGFGCEIEVPYSIPTPIRGVFNELYIEQRVLRAGSRKKKDRKGRKGETAEEKEARLEKIAKVNGLMVSIPNGCILSNLSGLKDADGNPERFMAPLVLFGVRNDSNTIKELEKFLKFRIAELNRKSEGKIYLNPAIKNLSRGASVCGSFGLPLPVWDKRGRKGKEFAGEVFSPIVKGSDWTGEPSKFLVRHYAAVLHAIDELDNSMSLKEARYVFNREVAIFKHKVNCIWNEKDPEAQSKKKALQSEAKSIQKELITLKKAAIASDSPTRRASLINRFNELNHRLKEVKKELRNFAVLKPAEKLFIKAKMEQGYAEVATKFPIFDNEEDDDEEDLENFNYTQYYWNLAKGSLTVEGVDFGAKRSELATTESWGYWNEEEEFLSAEEFDFGNHPTVKRIKGKSVDTIHKTLSSSSSSSKNSSKENSKHTEPNRKPSIGSGYGLPHYKCRMAFRSATNEKKKFVFVKYFDIDGKIKLIKEIEDN